MYLHTLCTSGSLIVIIEVVSMGRDRDLTGIQLKDSAQHKLGSLGSSTRNQSGYMLTGAQGPRLLE